MHLFEATALWDRTLATANEDERAERARTKLREAFLDFRERAAALADEIPQDLRLLTVHDVTHIDALWEIADLVLGEHYEINPVEAFVVGSAFLLHDLGMSLSAYNEGIDELKQHPDWEDITAAILRRQLERLPKPEEVKNPNPDVERLAKEQLLRNLHAKHAETLATCSFRHRSNDPDYHLLEATDLRQALGRLIGQVAYSHWWPIDKVAENFDRRIGSPVFCPREWRIDPLKLACLIRVADACHLDARRAPGFLRALRKPMGAAEEHWLFQEHLQKPDVEHERIVFSTSRPFPRDESRAWWLCYDMLRSADRELRDVDSLLRDTGRIPFATKGVAGCDDPSRLQKHIPTEGWEPIDVQIKVTDVASLVRKLGGKELYGDDPTVPLRELIQNGADAVRALRLAEDKSADWGAIHVELEEIDGKDVITVMDNGVGMSREVLCGPFIDFGTSYWGSALMVQEHPGLMRKGFASTGKYGIGFYSVFMWGSRVEVVSRSSRAGPADTLVLEFNEGLQSRPILRRAGEEEQRSEVGTTVRVWMDRKVDSNGGLLSGVVVDDHNFQHQQAKAPSQLQRLCAWLCPASDVDIYVKANKTPLGKAVIANDWKTIGGVELLDRILGDSDFHETSRTELCERLGATMRPVESEDGQIFARLAIRVFREMNKDRWIQHRAIGVVTAGAFRAFALGDIAGIVLGRATTASRLQAAIDVPAGCLASWASQQAEIIQTLAISDEAKKDLAGDVRGFGGDTRSLPIALGIDGWMTFDEIAQKTWPDEVVVADENSWSLAKREHVTAILLPNVLAVASGRNVSSFTFGCGHQSKATHEHWRFHCGTLEGAVLEALAKAWNTGLQQVLDASELHSDEHEVVTQIGKKGDGDKINDEGASIIRNPSKL